MPKESQVPEVGGDREPSPDPHLTALAHEVQSVSRYPYHRRWGGKMRLALHTQSGAHITYLEAGQQLAACQDPALQAVGLWAIGRSMDKDETVSVSLGPEGRSVAGLTPRALFLEALRRDATNCRVYTSLGCTLTGEHLTLTLPDGRALTESELYTEALVCDPCYAMAYYNLGVVTAPNTTVLLPDGRALCKQELFLEALRHNPCCSPAYCSLAFSLSPHETVVLHDGRTLDKQQLHLEALHCDALDPYSYCNLGYSLGKDETVQLRDGRTLNQCQLYVEALRCDSSHSMAYNNLGFALKSPTILLADGRTLSKQQLFLEALRCDAANSLAYINLGNALDTTPVTTVVLHDGRALSKRQLYLEALRCDPSNTNMRAYLVDTMQGGEVWSRRTHSLLFESKTNALFATLLLGVQRLEEAGTLALAHQAMLEDMLECWTKGDERTS